MGTILMVILFIFISSYIGLFIRAQIEEIRISKHLIDIFTFPFYIFFLPVFLIILPYMVWSVSKEDKKISKKTGILMLFFIYLVYKEAITSIVYKSEGLISIFFMQLKYKEKYEEKYYKKRIKLRIANSFVKYIGIGLAENKLIKKYGII